MYKSQLGNALIVVLAAVALFAALSATFSRTTSSGAASLDSEELGLYSSRILERANIITYAVNHMIAVNGCSEQDISFENDIVANYEHSPVARDECKVFHPLGGGLAYVAPEDRWLDYDQSGQDYFGEILFSGNMCLDEVGGDTCSTSTSSDDELLMLVPFIHKELCIKLNEKLRVGTAGDDPLQDGSATWGASDEVVKFIGNYANLGTDLLISMASAYDGKPTLCIEGGTTRPGDDTYIFIHSLIIR